MKRKCLYLLILLLVIMITNILIVNYAFAEEVHVINAEKAEKLRQLGLFKGSSYGFELERQPFRVEGAVMLVRLLGKEEESLDSDYTNPFMDVPGWADSYISYMYHEGLTKGTSTTTFGSNDTLNASQYITFVLRSLGYSDSEGDFKWNESADKAFDIGLLTQEEYNSISSGKVFLRDDVVSISYSALNTSLKGQDKTLLDKLIYDEQVISEQTVYDTCIKQEDVEEDFIVSFKDSNLEAVIREEIGKNKGDIYKSDVSRITFINASNRNVSSLEGIENLEGLKSLTLWDNSLTDISPLKGLSKLENLSLDNNMISDIAPLRNLINLESLGLNNNCIKDISALSELVNIQKLYIMGNEIKDISALANMKKIFDLVIAENKISDISPLKNLTQLTYIHAGDNQISDISSLNNLVNLTGLIMYNNNITDIDVLGGLTELKNLVINNNKIKDINALSSLTNMVGLELANNQIIDISSLGAMTQLKWVTLQENQITSIEPLQYLTNYEKTLKLNDNLISDVSPLENFENLEALYLRNNQITDISALSNMVNMKELYLADNQITDISALSSLVNLEKLYLFDNQIKDISPLSGLMKLEELFLSRNKITDFTPILSCYDNLRFKDFELPGSEGKYTDREEFAIVEDSKNNLTIIAIDGLLSNPYNIGIKDAILFIVFRYKDDFDDFNKLSDNYKKKYMNTLVQNNYGFYLGSDSVCAMVVFKGKKYVEMNTGAYPEIENLELIYYENGEPVEIIVQDVNNNTYIPYKY